MFTFCDILHETKQKKRAQTLDSALNGLKNIFKAKIKAVYSRPYCCYGNLLYKRHDLKLFTNDWVLV